MSSVGQLFNMILFYLSSHKKEKLSFQEKSAHVKSACLNWIHWVEKHRIGNGYILTTKWCAVKKYAQTKETWIRNIVNSEVWRPMAIQTRNLCSAFNLSNLEINK